MNIALRISSRSKGGNFFCLYLTSEVVSPFNSLPPSMHNLYQRNVLGDILLYCIVYAVTKLDRSIYSGIVFSLVNHLRVLDDSNFHMLHNSYNLYFIFLMRKKISYLAKAETRQVRSVGYFIQDDHMIKPPKTK